MTHCSPATSVAQLSRRPRRVEARADRLRRVAERRRARPQPRAERVRLGGILLCRSPLPPPPRPHRRDPRLRSDLLRGERLPLRDLVPRRVRLEAAATAEALRRREADHQTETARRDADRRQVGDRLPVRVAKVAVPEHRPALPRRGRGDVDPRGRSPPTRPPAATTASASPPVYGRDAIRSTGCAPSAVELLHEGERVLAVLRIVVRPRRHETRACELVEHDHRRRATGLRDRDSRRTSSRGRQGATGLRASRSCRSGSSD